MRHFTTAIVLIAVCLQPLFAQDLIDSNNHQMRHLPHGAIARLGKGAIGQSDRAVVFSPDGRLVAVASGIGVFLYSVADPERSTLFPSDAVHSLSFSPDGKKLVTAGGQWRHGQIRLWDVETGARTRNVEGWSFGNATFSPDGKTLAYRAKDGVNIVLRDVASWIPETTSGRDGVSFLHCLTFSADGALIAAGYGDGAIILWDVVTRTPATTLKGHSDEVYSVAFSPNGSTLASGSGDETVMLWDMATRTNSATLRANSPVTSVAFSPDGSVVASGTWFRRVKLWNTTTGENIDTFNDHRDLVRAVSFSPDGSTLASASTGGTVKLRNLSSGHVNATDTCDASRA